MLENKIRTKDLISIIVPIYNVERYVSRCVNSLLQQTYKYIEIILIDDGSSDDSGKIIDNLSKIDNRIITIHEKNSGAAKARNLGLEYSSGEYIMFVDADDYVDKDICQKLLRGLVETKSECCFCGYATFNRDNKVITNYLVDKNINLTGIDALKKRYINGLNTINIVEPWGKLFKWDMWINIRFTNGLYYEDLDIMPYLYLPCSKITIVPYVGYYYFFRENSSSRGSERDDKRFIDAITIRKKHIELYKKYSIELYKFNILLLLELIIKSYKNKWIPKSYMIISKELFHKYRHECDIVPIKMKIRFLIFDWLKI